MRRFLTLAVAVLNGCSPSESPLGRATGVVTYQGMPVRAGSVVFDDAKQGAAFVAHLDEAGRFAFEVARGYGLPPGIYKVSIHPPLPKASIEFVAPNFDKKEYADIPARYRAATTSGFTAIVESGANPPFRFEMKERVDDRPK